MNKIEIEFKGCKRSHWFNQILVDHSDNKTKFIYILRRVCVCVCVYTCLLTKFLPNTIEASIYFLLQYKTRHWADISGMKYFNKYV